jgi:hypothetical protein
MFDSGGGIDVIGISIVVVCVSIVYLYVVVYTTCNIVDRKKAKSEVSSYFEHYFFKEHSRIRAKINLG